MKKFILISGFLFFTGLNVLMAQFVKVNPIPYYDYYLTEQYAAFQERGSGEMREKREVNVEVSTSSDANGEIYALVWIVKKNGSQTYGPYTVNANERLTVEVSGGKWGVNIQCLWDVSVSVWIDNVVPLSFNDFLNKNSDSTFPVSAFMII